jgi:hypothetical protein
MATPRPTSYPVASGGSVYAGVASPAIPAWVSALSLWHWHQIPNTALSGTPPTGPSGDYGDPSCKITDWVGAALKTEGSVYMIGMAGGHNDYFGNEVNVLRLNTAAPAWEEAVQRSAHADLLTQSPLNLDLTGASSHNYYSSQFINSRNRFVVFQNGGAYAAAGRIGNPPVGWPYPVSAGISPSVNFGATPPEYDAPNYIPAEAVGGNATAAMYAKHPVTEDVYFSCPGFPGSGFWKWTNATNSFAQVGSTNINYAGAAVDPNRNRILVVGDFSGTVPPRVLGLDGESVPGVTFGGLGPDALEGTNYPGLIYDEANDDYLAFFNESPIRVVRVAADNFAVDEPTITGTPPPQRVNGIQNSVQYVPELGGVVYAPTYSGNVYFMRTAVL